MQSKPSNQFERRASRIAKRDRQIYKEFLHYYEVKRLRYDDCVQQLADKWFLSDNSIEKIIKAQIKDK